MTLSGVVTVGANRSWPRRARLVVLVAAIAAMSAVAGAVFALVGNAAGPLVMFGLPVAAVLGAAMLVQPRIGLMLFVLVLPVGVAAVPGAPGDVKIVHLVAAAFATAVVVQRLGTGYAPLGWATPGGWLLGIGALALAATPRALDVPTAIKQDVTLAIGVALALAIPGSCRDLKELRPVIRVLLVVGAGTCATSFGSASQLQASYHGALVNNRAVGVFHQPNELGTFSGMLLMVAIGVFFGSRSLLERVLAAVSAVAAVIALALTFSRGAWIGAVLGAAFIVWLLPPARRAVILVGIPLLALMAGLGAFKQTPPQVQILTERVQSITTPAANPYDDRPAIYREAIHIIETHPFLGVGPENFVVAATKSASDTQTVAPLHAHNFLMTVAAEMGIPAALLLVGMTLSVGRRIRRASVLVSSYDRSLAVGLGAALVVLVGQGLVDFTMRNPTIFTFVWAMLGMALIAVRAVERSVGAGAATSSAAS
jgi:O-antigen ligase